MLVHHVEVEWDASIDPKIHKIVQAQQLHHIRRPHMMLNVDLVSQYQDRGIERQALASFKPVCEYAQLDAS